MQSGPTASVAIAQTDESAALPADKAAAPASISVVAWVPNREIDFPEWAEAGRRLGAMGRCGQWGIGDWIQYGNAKFGERYVRGARITGYDIQTLMNMVYVASKFAVSRRRENLSWSHHETLAALGSDEQDHWLDLAVARRLSVSDLRLELRRSRRGLRPAGATRGSRDALPLDARVITCPNCGHELALPARERKTSLKQGTSAPA
jgi:hypothetical protein